MSARLSHAEVGYLYDMPCNTIQCLLIAVTLLM